MNQILPAEGVLFYRSEGVIREEPIERYPSGEPRIAPPTYRPDAVLIRTTNLGDLFAGLAWIDGFLARGYPAPHLVLPFVPGGRQDRLLGATDFLFTIRTVAKFINALGLPSVTICDPHSDVTPALIDRCRVAPATIPADVEYAGVIAPDAGAEKRGTKVATTLGAPVYRAWKSRDLSTGKITGFGCEPLGKGHYLVVDDLCDGGGTFVGLGQQFDPHLVLLDLFVTHGLFTHPEGAEVLSPHYQTVYCSDSTAGEKLGATVIPICGSLLLGVR